MGGKRVSAVRWTALVGAGISVDAGVPMAMPVIDAVLDACIPTTWARDELKRSARGGRAGQRGPDDFLRFEVLLDWVAKLLDPELEVLDFLAAYPAPGGLHRRLAWGAADGALTIVTPNFHDLLEQAVDEWAPGRAATVLPGHPRWPTTSSGDVPSAGACQRRESPSASRRWACAARSARAEAP